MQQQQPRVRLGRVCDGRTTEDGTRPPVDRIRPRGLTEHRADLDEWCAQIAPSSALRKWYGHNQPLRDSAQQQALADLLVGSRAG